MTETSKQYFIGEEHLEGITRSANPFTFKGQVIGLPFHLEELINKYDKYVIPKSRGIYHLFYRDRLVYVGMSKNLRNRLLNHLGNVNMPFDCVLWFCMKNRTIENILRIETNMIKLFQPPLNEKI